MNSTNKQLRSGVFYTAIAKYSGMFISLGVVAVLSRTIPKADFGTVAIATVIIAFFSIFSDLGIGPGIIQNQNLSKRDLSNIFSLTVWIGVLLSTLFFFSSTLIANFFNDPTLINICRILSVNLFFASLNIVPNALLVKAKRFRFIAFRTLIVQATCGIIAVTSAYCGAGIYALLVNPIGSSIIIFFINLKQNPQRLRLTLGIESMRKIFSYSMYQFFFNLINFASRNLDKLLIGKYLGNIKLAYYDKSYMLMMLPLQNITHVISPVMHPIFAEYQNDIKHIASSYEKVVRFLAFIGFPLSALLFFIASELILLIFGPLWVESIPVFKIFTISVGIQIILSTSGSIFQASNATKMLFICGLLSTILNVMAISIGLFIYNTAEAIATSVVISFSANFTLCFFLMYRITFKLSMTTFFKQLISPLILTAIMILALYAISLVLIDINIILSLIIKGSLFLVLFFLYIQYTNEFNIISKIKSLIKK